MSTTSDNGAPADVPRPPVDVDYGAFEEAKIGIVTFEPEKIGALLQDWLRFGSINCRLTMKDVEVNVNSVPANEQTCSVMDLVNCGMKIFDAIIWIAGGRTIPLVANTNVSNHGEDFLRDTAVALFFCYFYLLTQARYPPKKGDKGAGTVPNFLTKIMSIDSSPQEIRDIVASFDVDRFDPLWVRHVSFEGFDSKAMNRFALGVAGYRCLSPFKYLRPVEKLEDADKALYETAKRMANAPPTWSVHPLTRKSEFLAAYGNFNGVIDNIAAKVFSKDQLDNLARLKIIYRTPTVNVKFAQYGSFVYHAKFFEQDRIFAAANE